MTLSRWLMQSKSTIFVIKALREIHTIHVNYITTTSGLFVELYSFFLHIQYSMYNIKQTFSNHHTLWKTTASVIPSPTFHHSIKIHSFPHFPSTALVYVIAFCSGCSGRSIIVALVKGYARSSQICINSQIHSHQPSEKERQELHLDKSPRYSFKITPPKIISG